MRARRIITMFRVGPALLANIVDNLVALFFCIAVLVLTLVASDPGVRAFAFTFGP